MGELSFLETAISQEEMRLFIGRVRRKNEEAFNRTGKKPAAYVHSYGCQQNVADGEKLAVLLAEMGYSAAGEIGGADFVLYNTCAVREGAEDRVFGNVGALKHAKKRNPAMVIALCGCMTQQEHVAARIKKSFPFVDLLFGAGAMHRLPELLYHVLSTGVRAFETLDPTAPIQENIPVRRDGGTRAWLPVMNGCDNFCSYCIVPVVRGRERSREPAHILAEAEQLIREGCRELTLLGQNVNSYGKGLAEELSFSGLLRRICALPGDFRLRFMTSHPKDATRELIDTIAGQEKIYNYLHLPVQSGSDRVLKRMNRNYTAGHYLSLIDYARGKIPGITFTSDIIVGFPGETEEDFQATLELVRRVGFQSLFTFIYSRREGTKAAGMPDQIPMEEKKRRLRELARVQDEITRRVFEGMAGQVQAVLVDGAKPGTPGLLTGRNAANMIVDFPGPPELAGSFARVRITQAANWALVGELTVES
jgi:tRNA-2-methylthio-N6-dimethylallyladenosine synthase